MKTLKEVYQKSFLMGNIYTPRLLDNEPLKTMMQQQFNTITAENIMKPVLIQPERDVFRFDAADAMMAYGQNEGFVVVGHTLAWHQQTLNWIDEETVTKEEAIDLLRTHMTTLMSRYKGQILAWDVLNEAIIDGTAGDPKEWRNYLRETPWLRMIGEDYVELVFRVAHEIDPDARLYYNDYNLNYPAKRKATYYMVKELCESGVPIHGIGMQGHFHTNTPVETVEESLALFSQLPDIEISVTELDVTVTGSEHSNSLSKEHEVEQGQYYARLFQIYKKYDNIIKRITFWGTDDETSWRCERFPTIFNKDYSPKLAFDAIIDPDGFLAKYPIVKKDTKQVAVVSFGTPTVGENLNWTNEAQIFANRQLTAWEGATARIDVMWDEEAVFVKAVVTDKSPSDLDQVDVYFSFSNMNLGDYQIDDYHITVTRIGALSFNRRAEIEEIEHQVVTGELGYTVYLRLPAAVRYNQYIGFDVQVRDYNDRDELQSMAVWNDVTGALATNTKGLGQLVMKR